ncbi:MAG: glycosyltransferase family 2 protein [Rhodospirillaceae bacterium]|nr:glycosyltransferase family 2 protein [Rhodospirillaceae bacterium]MBT6135893.1 glycosyltransferase family 2 protein [Rhodospirillaceae bacterium]
MISVVLRAKNEAAWIGRCLTALANQRIPNIDVILVDNESTDDTVAIAESFGVTMRYISRDEFSFGRALNIGVEAARHEVVSMLSSHCVPIDELWADYQLAHLGPDGDAGLCGIYGRQEPLPETSAIDRRDLWTTFRDERVRQREDYFFHNANSAIRKSIWNDHPFDEEISGVEDREWGKRMIALNYEILYEPHMRVYHHHGIHQGRDEGRAKRVAEVIDVIRMGT